MPNVERSLEREKSIVKWLQTISKDASAIYLLGDVFDFWFEYKTVVPKGFVRFLAAICEITDSGIPVYLFPGNLLFDFSIVYFFYSIYEQKKLQFPDESSQMLFGRILTKTPFSSIYSLYRQDLNHHHGANNKALDPI